MQSHNMNKVKEKLQRRARRHARVRAKISGTDARPRLSVFKSNKYFYAQIINDEKGTTLVGMSSSGVKGKTMTEKAKEMGALLAKKAKEKKIKSVVFDKGGFLYTGKIKAFADGARKGGLNF